MKLKITEYSNEDSSIDPHTYNTNNNLELQQTEIKTPL